MGSGAPTSFFEERTIDLDHSFPWPEFIRWSFGEKEFASPVEAQSSLFRFSFRPAAPREKKYSFRGEVMAACERIDDKRNGRTVALCYSGGVDSELIATCFHSLGIPFELYFLDLWGINRATFDDNSQDFLSRIGKKAHIIELAKDVFYDSYSCPMFQELGCEYPTYLALTWLFEQIPETQFIVAGDGDLNREGSLFTELGRKHPVPDGAQGLHAPFSTASIAYYLWARRRRRAGEFYFFSSTAGLIASMITDPLFDSDFPVSSTRRVIYGHFPEIKARPKTTNWDGDAYLENRRIRHWLERNVRKFPDYRFWRRGSGTVVRLEDIFLPHSL